VGRHDDAKAIFNRVIPRAQRLGDQGLVDLVGGLIQLSRVYEALGDVPNAIKVADDAARVAEAKFGRQAGLTAFAMVWLGRMNSLAKHYEVAEFSLNESMTILKDLKSQDPSAELQIVQQHAEHYLRKGDKDKAMTLFRQGLAICRKVEPSLKDPYVTASTAAMLRGLLRSSDGSSSEATSERAEWQGELKGRLEKLKQAHALTAEEKAWLAELAA
jgi:tetratricopeptide (TPR) repeat protein